MKISFGLFFSFIALVAAEDVLFIEGAQNAEYDEALSTLGLTAKVVSESEWRDLSTSDFASFKAIVVSDPYCNPDGSIPRLLDDTKDIWGPAVLGNIILIGKPLSVPPSCLLYL